MEFYGSVVARSALIAALLSWAIAMPALCASGDTIVGDYELEVLKSQRVLLVKQGDKIARKFIISHGRGGRGDKHERGDKKTPVGTYQIVKIKDQSAFHSFLLLNYPNLKDALHGLKERRITLNEFERILQAIQHRQIPPQNTPLGGSIGIHGIGPVNEERLHIHNEFNWTKGCIALTNEELNELKKYVHVGTKVVINE
jgi:murein L,D-transpeptidase YafK